MQTPNDERPMSNVEKDDSWIFKSGFPNHRGKENRLGCVIIVNSHLIMKYDLEQRLINYGVMILDIAESLPESKGSNHLVNQIVRSGTAPSLMYAEAQSSESRKDFIHKMRLPLKELRETYNCLQILNRRSFHGEPNERMTQAITESQELIAIFAKSIDTAIRNSRPKQ